MAQNGGLKPSPYSVFLHESCRYPLRPRARAALSPATVRSRISSRSNSAARTPRPRHLAAGRGSTSPRPSRSRRRRRRGVPSGRRRSSSTGWATLSAGMDPTAWTVVIAAIVVLAAIGASFRSLRGELRAQGRRIDAQVEDRRHRIDAQTHDLRNAIDAQGDRGVREQPPRSPTPIARRPDPLAAAAVQRERAAHLQGLVEGRRLAAAMMGGEVAAAGVPGAPPRPAGPEEGAGPAETARGDEKASRAIRVVRFRPPPA